MSPPETTHFGYQTIPTVEKTKRVKKVFESVAKRYDIMNDVMSFGLHRFWKRIAIAKANVREGQTVLDLASGTGDLAILLAKQVGQKGTLILSDINADMMNLGRKRLIDRGIVKPIQFVQNNAECLPFNSDTFDCVTLAFGLRNMTHKEHALIEILRILKPGGRVVISEFSHPTSQILSSLYDTYSFSVIPLLGKLICNDSESYRYLAESIRMHPTQDELKNQMSAIGFERVHYQNLNGGIVAIHTGFKF